MILIDWRCPAGVDLTPAQALAWRKASSGKGRISPAIGAAEAKRLRKMAKRLNA